MIKVPGAQLHVRATDCSPNRSIKPLQTIHDADYTALSAVSCCATACTPARTLSLSGAANLLPNLAPNLSGCHLISSFLSAAFRAAGPVAPPNTRVRSFSMSILRSGCCCGPGGLWLPAAAVTGGQGISLYVMGLWAGQVSRAAQCCSYVTRLTGNAACG